MDNINAKRLIGLLFLVIAGWGIYLATGAFLANRNIIPALVVLAVFGLFLGGWALALRQRGRRTPKP